MRAALRQQTSEPGRLIAGRYRLARPLSHGGTVWLGTDPQGREMALKFGPARLIEREYRMLATCRSPAIVRAFDCVVSGPDAAIVMEYLAGGDLVALAGLAPRHWLPAAGGLIEALAHLHEAGVIHRDVKARNVMLDTEDRPRLIDFGSAVTVGSAWSPAGTTPEIVAPDRGRAGAAPADDVYALAVLLHELAFGGLPGAGRRMPATGLGELGELVDAALAGRAAAVGIGLERFRTVIESLREQV